MKSIRQLSLLLATIMTSALIFAQTAKPANKPLTVTAVLDRQLSNVESEVVPAADALDAGKYEFAPTNGEFKGVRTFAQEVKHLAAANYQIGAALLNEKSPVDAGDPNGPDNGPDNLKDKAAIMDYLKNSFAYLHKGIATINEKTILEQVQSPFGPNKASRLGLAIVAISHPQDHYGQMVEYLRMNGIIPPASRQ
ncbi:MAG TPA: DinB family protein [Terriglobales bacterium]|nr:DinB family protein [Terriglobales bacterium]